MTDCFSSLSCLTYEYQILAKCFPANHSRVPRLAWCSRSILSTSSQFKHLNPSQSHLYHSQLPLQSIPGPSARVWIITAMFRNALRQSSRSVGAISATSRVAVVSSERPTTMLYRPGSPFFACPSSTLGEIASHCQQLKAHVHLLPRSWTLTITFHRPEQQHLHPSPSHQSKPEAMPQMPRPLPQKSLQSSNSAFAAYKRRPVLPRLDVSCLSGRS